MNKYAICIFGLMVGLAACKNNLRENAAENKDACVITPGLKELIKLETVLTRPVSQELELTGSVSYDQDHIYSYQSLVSGVVRAVFFKIGDYVQKGQVLAEVKTTELSGQKSELLKARAELKLAQRKLQAAKNLHADGVASDRELQEAGNEVTAAEAEINRIGETIALQGGNISNGLLVIRAPLSGYVVEKKITAGTQIDVGQDDLFVLSDLKKIWVLANVYTAQLEMVKTGQQVEIQSTAYPGRIFSGRISRISNVFDADERVLKAIIELDNRDLRLKPSMMVSVNLYLATGQRAVAIPKDAVLFADNASYVMLYKTDCNVSAVKIKPVAGDKKFYYTQDEQVKENDTIISRNHLLIYNKVKGR